MADGQQGDAQLSIFDAEATAQIRHVWHEGRWFFSVIDMVGMLTDSPNPRVYWGVLKRRLADEGFGELFTICKQSKMLASDAHTTRPLR